MSTTPNFDVTRGFSPEEHALHHHAAVVKMDLDRFHASAAGKDEEHNFKEWVDKFMNHLVFLIS
jgi:hypothetical protein